MTRQKRPDAATPVAPAQSATAAWSMWPWGLLDGQVELLRRSMAVLDYGGKGLEPATILESLLAAQAKFVAAWIEQVLAAQAQWLELVKGAPTLDAGRLAGEDVLAQWVDAWKPAHAEEFVA